MQRKLYLFLLSSLLVTLPVLADGNLLVGTIDVQATVSESGGAVVSIPIDVPAGINGMQPSLSLVYNSQSGYGIAGWGWSLSGISSISRTGSTVYHDGTKNGVTFTNTDNLLLDGQRLMLMSGYNLSYNAAYHTEMESGQLVTFLADSTCFSVQSKSGIIGVYGNRASSRLGTDSKTLAWYISKCTDAAGNYVTYSYEKENNPAELNISRIDYTGNGSSSPVWNIRFEYQTSAAQKQTFVYGEKYARSKRLTDIHIYSGNTRLYSYTLEYDTTYIHPRLTTITKTASNGDYYNPVSFTWSAKSTGSLKSASLSIAPKDNVVYGDFNGDGKNDIFSYKTGNSTAVLYLNTSSITTVSFSAQTVSTDYPFQEIRVCDYNGDGKADIVGRYVYNGNQRLKVLLGTTSGLTSAYTFYMTSDKYDVGDFDGDCMDEIVTGDNVMHGYLQTDISFPSVNIWSNTNGRIYTFTDHHCALDFNGNGKQDLFFVTDTEYGIFEFDETTSSFVQYASSLLTTIELPAAYLDYLHFGDFNGDGLTDMACPYWDSTNGICIRIFLSRGDGFEHDWTCQTPSYAKFSVCDFNNDGFSDLGFSVFGQNSAT